MTTDEIELFHLRAERGVLMDFIRELAKNTTSDYAALAMAYVEGLESMREWENAKAKHYDRTWDELTDSVTGRVGRRLYTDP